MARILKSLVLTLLLASFALANGPVAPTSEDVSSGYVDPILSEWGLDVVSWATAATSPVTSGRSASGILGNYMYVFGSGSLVNIAIAFNLTTQQWENSTPAPLGVDNWTGVATNDAIYIVGRYTGSAYGNEIQKFTPTGGGPTGTWSQVANYPIAGCGMAAAWDGGDYIYVAGGNPAPSTAANRYSISGNVWTAIAPLPAARAYTGGAFVGGKFYVLGGTVAAAANTMVAYDPATNTWSSMANLPTNVWFATFSTTFDNTHVMSIGGGGGYSTWPATTAVQIYDPATNAWTQETPLPAAAGCNAARYAGGGVAVSTGGYTGTAWLGTTYRGTGFFSGTANVALNLTYTSGSPVPPGGGPLNYNVILTNNESGSLPFQYWCTYTQGTTVVTAFGPISRIAPGGPGYNINRDLTQTVAGSLGSGLWTYTGYVGSYPGTIWAQDSFTFTKNAVGDGGPFYSENMLTGWDEEPAAVTATPANYILHGASPNPFNPTTTLSFVLPQAGQVNLSVYNVAGHQVAELVNGYRAAGSHDVTFDASNLASGLYIYQLSAGDFNATGKMVLMK